MTVAAPVNKRIESGSLVLWRPGLTAWIASFGNDGDAPAATRADTLRSFADSRAFDHHTWESPGALHFSYRLAEQSGDRRLPALYGYAVGASGHLQLALYFDTEDDHELARKLLASIILR